MPYFKSYFESNIMVGVDYGRLSVEELCQYMEQKHYRQVDLSLQTAENYIQGGEVMEYTDLLFSLFFKIRDEWGRLVRKETMILFPFLNEVHKGDRKINSKPIEWIKEVHQKILDLFYQVRPLVNYYSLQPSWSNAYQLFCSELYLLDQQVLEIINVKENFLFPKLFSRSSEFNLYSKDIIL